MSRCRYWFDCQPKVANCLPVCCLIVPIVPTGRYHCTVPIAGRSSFIQISIRMHSITLNRTNFMDPFLL